MRQFTTENTTHEQAVAALNAVARWINESHAYLSEIGRASCRERV